MRQPKIVIINFNIGNLRSLWNSITRIGYRKLQLTGNPKEIEKADILILPGVGNFAQCMNNLRARNLEKLLATEVLEKHKPILGICAGMQLLASESEENGLQKGLGFISGSVVSLRINGNLPVPHNGWNNLSFLPKANPDYKYNFEDKHFYFNHSYHLKCNQKYVIASVKYSKKIVAVIQKDNIYGVQFHPEKSQKIGLQFLDFFFKNV